MAFTPKFFKGHLNILSGNIKYVIIWQNNLLRFKTIIQHDVIVIGRAATIWDQILNRNQFEAVHK